MTTVDARPTLVGMDGSEGAARALDWAAADASAADASALGAGLTVACVVQTWPTLRPPVSSVR